VSCNGQVLDHAELLRQIADVCAQLDCVHSLAETAVDQNYVRPTIVEDGVIFIKVR
jgi:DNA mismatch repair ATPase MutS